jgi:aminomethyltransferase
MLPPTRLELCGERLDVMADALEGLARTPLHELHLELGARMVPFAGYALPLNYTAGIKVEHLYTRVAAGLFDVSHMGQLRLDGVHRVAALEALVPVDVAGLAEGRVRYGFFTNDVGGILDDLLIANAGDHLYVVVNAARKAEDIAHLRDGLGGGTTLRELDDRAMLALQGPKASAVLARLEPALAEMAFMSTRTARLDGVACRVSRSGYSGEDGYEIAVPAEAAETLARRLLAFEEVAAIGLGARDTLRLEAGLPLYGHDLSETTTPAEADLTWAIGKRRREEGGFPGEDVIVPQIREGVTRKRVGLVPEGRAPVREGAEVLDDAGRRVGRVTSGAFSPSLGRPIAMAYVESDCARPETRVFAQVRGKPLPCLVVKLPFVRHNFYRG